MGYYSLASAGTNCKGAVAPTLYDATASFAPGALTDDSVAALTIAAGSPAINHDFMIENKSCYPVTANVTFQDGGDCEPCTTDTVTTTVAAIPIAANTGWNQDFPGVVQAVEIVLDADIPAAATTGADVRVAGVSAADCPECLPVAV